VQPSPTTAHGRIATLEASLYMRNQLLRDTDWASMTHSLEVRVPLVDAHLLRTLAPALVTQTPLNGKSLLAHCPSTPLPDAVTGRRKTGFTVPVGKWLEKDATLDGWRKVPLLTKRGVHWARRWAFTLASMETAL